MGGTAGQPLFDRVNGLLQAFTRGQGCYRTHEPSREQERKSQVGEVVGVIRRGRRGSCRPRVVRDHQQPQ
jgi:hypothetical protein